MTSLRYAVRVGKKCKTTEALKQTWIGEDATPECDKNVTAAKGICSRGGTGNVIGQLTCGYILESLKNQDEALIFFN